MGIVHTVGVALCARSLRFLLDDIGSVACDLTWFFAIIAQLFQLGFWYRAQGATPTMGLFVKVIFGIELFSHHH